MFCFWKIQYWKALPKHFVGEWQIPSRALTPFFSLFVSPPHDIHFLSQVSGCQGVHLLQPRRRHPTPALPHERWLWGASECSAVLFTHTHKKKTASFRRKPSAWRRHCWVTAEEDASWMSKQLHEEKCCSFVLVKTELWSVINNSYWYS